MVNCHAQINKRKRLNEGDAVQMAVDAATGDSDIWDTPMTEFDSSPTSLDLHEQRERQAYFRCGHPAVDRCPKCGSLLCEDCITKDEG